MHEKIQAEIPIAMRAKEAVRLTTLRGILAAFTNESVALKRTPKDKLSDMEAGAVVRRLVKQRRDSIEQFEKGGRRDLADNERAELKILEEFLPASMSEEKIREIVLKKKSELGITEKSKIGQLIGAVVKETGDEASGAVIKKLAEEIL